MEHHDQVLLNGGDVEGGGYWPSQNLCQKGRIVLLLAATIARSAILTCCRAIPYT